MTPVRFGRLSMRRTLTTLMVLAMAAILPIVTIAGVCGAEATCCASAPGPVLNRADCCPDPCADVTREGTSASDAAKQSIRIDRMTDEASTVAMTSSVPASPYSAEGSASEPSPPDLDRRLASLSILLI